MGYLSAAWAVLKGIGGALAGLASFVPGWLWLALLAGSISHGCVVGHQRDTARRDLAGLKAQVLEQETTRAEVARLAEAGRRAAERDHAARMAAIDQRTANAKQNLDRDVRAALDGVQQRPARAAGGGAVPGGAGANLGACTGAGLPREDAAFLVGEAAAAKATAIQLDDCRSKYDAGVALTGGWETYRKALIQSTNPPKGNAP